MLMDWKFSPLQHTGFNELNNTGVVIGGAVDPSTWKRQLFKLWKLDRLEIGYLALWIIKESVDLILRRFLVLLVIRKL
jgi:hypothetical protein